MEEIEIKFADIDIKKMRGILKKSGAKLVHPMRLMRRQIFKNAEFIKTRQYIRVRDEGGKITMTHKNFAEKDTKYAQETETDVGDFDAAVAILVAAGIPKYAYQETKREEYELDGAQICIDEWPWIAPFVEIEAKSEQTCKTVAAKLGFDFTKALYGAVDTLYHQKYPHSNFGINDVPLIKFGEPLPKCLCK